MKLSNKFNMKFWPGVSGLQKKNWINKQVFFYNNTSHFLNVINVIKLLAPSPGLTQAHRQTEAPAARCESSLHIHRRQRQHHTRLSWTKAVASEWKRYILSRAQAQSSRPVSELRISQSQVSVWQMSREWAERGGEQIAAILLLFHPQSDLKFCHRRKNEPRCSDLWRLTTCLKYRLCTIYTQLLWKPNQSEDLGGGGEWLKKRSARLVQRRNPERWFFLMSCSVWFLHLYL